MISVDDHSHALDAHHGLHSGASGAPGASRFGQAPPMPSGKEGSHRHSGGVYISNRARDQEDHLAASLRDQYRKGNPNYGPKFGMQLGGKSEHIEGSDEEDVALGV